MDREKCKACDGDGEERGSYFAGEPCKGCNGRGFVLTDSCPICGEIAYCDCWKNI